ncbi:MAG: cell division protein FtsA [Paludibacter sp.]
MISNKQFIAIDLGNTRISAMAAEIQPDGTLKILGEESKLADDVKHGIVEQRTGASSKVIELKKLLQNSSKIHDISMVSVAIGAKTMKVVASSVSRFVGKPNTVTDILLAEMAEECKRNFQQPDITIFDIIPISYFLDNKRTDEPIGKNGSQITGNYHLVIGNSLINEKIEGCFDRTGLLLEHTPTAVEALSTVLLEEEDRELGCAMINLGATTTTLAVYSEGVLQNLLVVPLGAKNITKDIQELGITEANAERLKCLKGVALESMVTDPIYIQIPDVDPNNPQVRISTKFLATIIEARLEEILHPIFETITKLEFPLGAGIVITGGGSKLGSIIGFFEEKTDIQTRIGDHSGWLSEDTDVKYNDIRYAQLIGSIALTDEFRQQHPIEETVQEPSKKPKLPNKNLKEKITQRMFNFFNDDNKLS